MLNRNRVRTKEERKNLLKKKNEEYNRVNGILKAREIQALKDQTEHQKNKKTNKIEFTVDVWNNNGKHKTANYSLEIYLTIICIF